MKRNLLFLHAALGTKKQFTTLKEMLQPDFNCYDLNFEGHGGRKSVNNFSIQLFTENALDFMDENHLNQVDIFGYSMGGFVGLNLALKYPERVGKIVTLGTKFDWNKETTAKEVGFLKPEKIKEKVPHYAQKLATEHAPLSWEDVMRHTAKMMIDLSEGRDVDSQNFKAIHHSVTIGIGSEDQMVSFEESQEMAELLPNGNLVKLDGVPHPIDKIEPEKLSIYIKESLAKESIG